MDLGTTGFDASGLWREDAPGARMHCPWDAITAIAVSAFDCVVHIEKIVEITHASGEVFELNAGLEGLDEVLDEVADRFALRRAWRDALAEVSPGEPVELWGRAVELSGATHVPDRQTRDT